MQKFFDTKCVYRTDEDNQIGSWKGSFLLDDDGWFEGIVNDTTGVYQGDNFVFGVHVPEKGIELYSLAPIDIRYPIVFHGDVAGSDYSGEMENITLLGPTYCGSSIIKTGDKMCDENVIQSLKDRIKAYKDSMDDTCALFYGRYLEIRDALCQIFSKNFEGKGFTEEEISELMQVLDPMNKKVLNDTTEELASQFGR